MNHLPAAWSAFARAYYTEHAEHPAFSDPIAKKLLSKADYQNICDALEQGKDFFSAASVWEIVKNQLAPMPVARSRYCEDCLATELQTGTQQYVLLGAGYDTIVWRHPEWLHQLSVFEVDRPELLAEKQKRIQQAGLSIPPQLHTVPMDFRSDALLEQLLAANFDPTKKTVFSLLGVSYYLTESELLYLFQEISAFAAEGSTVILDYADEHLWDTSSIRIQRMLALAQQSGEPMHFCTSELHLVQLLESAHFLLYETLSPEEMQERYLQGSALVAFSNIHYAMAVLKGTPFFNTKEKILQTALKLFSKKGFSAVSVREIAGALGLTQSALYKHYPSKQAILDALFERAETTLPMKFCPSDANIQNAICSWFHAWTETAFGTAFRNLLVLERQQDTRAADWYDRLFFQTPLTESAAWLQRQGAVHPAQAAQAFYAPIFFLLWQSERAADVSPMQQLQAYLDTYFKEGTDAESDSTPASECDWQR